MPRYARPHVTGGLFHVISRFHNGEFLLNIENARQHYLSHLSSALAGSDTRLLAYCLMSSHIHLVLQCGTRSLGEFTRAVHSGWAIWVNKKSGRFGTVMAERPKSVLCHAETYGLELVRYVHNNPVRAGLASKATDSGWSSHRAYLGLEDKPDWLDTTPVLNAFGAEKNPEAARTAFSSFVEEGGSEPRRPEFSGEVSLELARHIRSVVGGPVEISYPVLGPDEFILDVYKGQVAANQDHRRFLDSKVGTLEVLKAVCDETGLDENLLLGRTRIGSAVQGRRLVAWIWCERMRRKQVDVAELFGCRPHAVSYWLRTMRVDGLPLRTQNVLNRIVENLSTSTTGKPTEPFGNKTKNRKNSTSPTVLVLKRSRNTR
jgi:putative transposase